LRPAQGGFTNAKLWELVWTRKLGEDGDGKLEEKEKVPRPMKTNEWNRQDLVVNIKGWGRVMWFHLCWFYLSGQKRYGTWRGFRGRVGLEVDHGRESSDTLAVDYRRLELKPKRGREGRGNASQGGPIRKKLQLQGLCKKPAKR
jgi:hypothetical protein